MGKVIDVVIPVMGHPAMVDDAIASVYPDILSGHINRLVVVNDGCKYSETFECLRSWQSFVGNSMTVLNCRNGGLSVARNRGISEALRQDPDLDAIYLLDSDNILSLEAGSTMHHLLEFYPDADWFYPDFDFFGQTGHFLTSSRYSLLTHAQTNICEAGSLIRRRVFDRGVRFDESMRQGYEDWDFWLQSAKFGFRGQAANRPLLRYRKRPVSMLSHSHDRDNELRNFLQTKHRWLFHTPKLLELESREFPRFAFFDGSTHAASLLTDPYDKRSIKLHELERRIMATFADPYENHSPAYFVFMRQGLESILSKHKLLRSFLWNSERRWERAEGNSEVDQFYLEPSTDGHKIDLHYASADRLADVAVISLASLKGLVMTADDMTARQFDHSPSTNSGRCWSMAIEGAPEFVDSHTVSGIEMLRGFVLDLRRSKYRGTVEANWNWRERGAALEVSDAVAITRKLSGGGIVFPMLKKAKKWDVAFVLPIVNFGGVEKVAASVARELQSSAYRCHLVVVSDRPIQTEEWALDAFATVNWVPDPSAIDWTGPEFMGTAEPSWGNPQEKSDLLGMLSSMDVVINCHAAALHKVADTLRRQGVVMISHEHLLERSTNGRTYGPPKLALAYEYAYDMILTCSEQLSAWLHSRGVPEAKLCAVINAPGYPLPKSKAATVLKSRSNPDITKPLRVLFMGRLDPQKGIDRVAAIFQALVFELPNVSLTVAGGTVVNAEEQEIPLPPEAKFLGPVRGVDALTKLLLETDIMILPSLYEGLPLSILEAQRCGVVVIATDVGAVNEGIEHGVSGYILPEDGCETSFVELIKELDADRVLLDQISQQSAASKRNWSNSTLYFRKWLGERLKAKRANLLAV